MLMLNWIATHKRLTLVIFAIAILLVAGSFFLFQNLKNRFSPTPKQETQVTQPVPLSEPSGDLTLSTSKKQYSPTEMVDLKAVANSANLPITGFDIVIEYDPEFFTLSNKRSDMLSDYTYFGKLSGNTLRVSGILRENSQTGQIFNNTELLNLTFSPKKTGKTQFKVIFAPNATNDSNLITKDGKDVLGKASGVEVEIR